MNRPTRKVWRDHTRGDCRVLTLKGGALTKLGGGAPEASPMFGKFSSDGTRVGYVRGNNAVPRAWSAVADDHLELGGP